MPLGRSEVASAGGLVIREAMPDARAYVSTPGSEKGKPGPGIE
jgi:hypothetical protein